MPGAAATRKATHSASTSATSPGPRPPSAVGAVGDRREDPDAAFSLADLAAELLPGAVASDAGRVRALHRDEQHVVRAVAVEPRGDGEHASPAVAARQLRDRGGELVVRAAQ